MGSSVHFLSFIFKMVLLLGFVIPLVGLYSKNLAFLLICIFWILLLRPVDDDGHNHNFRTTQLFSLVSTFIFLALNDEDGADNADDNDDETDDNDTDDDDGPNNSVDGSADDKDVDIDVDGDADASIDNDDMFAIAVAVAVAVVPTTPVPTS